MSTQVSRRGFLTGAALAGAAVAGMGLTSCGQPQQSASAEGGEGEDTESAEPTYTHPELVALLTEKAAPDPTAVETLVKVYTNACNSTGTADDVAANKVSADMDSERQSQAGRHGTAAHRHYHRYRQPSSGN